MLMFEIIPAILEKEWGEIEKKIELVKPFTKSVHIDIIDGKFTDNITFLDPAPFKKYTNDLFFELHMMVEDPVSYLKSWADVGFKRFLGHIEKMPDQEEFVAKAQQLGEVGLALDGPTEFSEVKVPIIDLDTLYFYTAESVGHSGAVLKQNRLEKFRKFAEENSIPIGVDGGINENTIIDAFKAGARRFGVTNGIFKADNPQKSFIKLNEACNRLLR